MSKSKETTYIVKTTVTKGTASYGNYPTFYVKSEGSGFVGESGWENRLGIAFEKAYEDLMAKVAEAIFEKNQ